MSWAARIEHTEGGLRLRFATPTTTLDMTSETAAHLASLIAIEARSQVAGVVRTLSDQREPCLNSAHEADRLGRLAAPPSGLRPTDRGAVRKAGSGTGRARRRRSASADGPAQAASKCADTARGRE